MSSAMDTIYEAAAQAFLAESLYTASCLALGITDPPSFSGRPQAQRDTWLKFAAHVLDAIVRRDAAAQDALASTLALNGKLLTFPREVH